MLLTVIDKIKWCSFLSSLICRERERIFKSTVHIRYRKAYPSPHVNTHLRNEVCCFALHLNKTCYNNNNNALRLRSACFLCIVWLVVTNLSIVIGSGDFNANAPRFTRLHTYTYTLNFILYEARNINHHFCPSISHWHWHESCMNHNHSSAFHLFICFPFVMPMIQWSPCVHKVRYVYFATVPGSYALITHGKTRLLLIKQFKKVFSNANKSDKGEQWDDVEK